MEGPARWCHRQPNRVAELCAAGTDAASVIHGIVLGLHAFANDSTKRIGQMEGSRWREKSGLRAFNRENQLTST